VCGRSGPQRIPISVTVSLETLLRLTDAPGELEGFGPIPAEVAREMAADGELRRWLTEETGKLLDVGDRTYRPSAALARFIRGRDRTCRFPSCDAPAVRCDLDHTLAFHTEGGRTVRVNLGALCRRHHRLKHEKDWIYELLSNGDVRWTAPSGRVFVKEAERYEDDGVLSAFFAAGHRRDRERRERRERREAKQRPSTRDLFRNTKNGGSDGVTAEQPPF
jgi:hypothetical protein